MTFSCRVDAEQFRNLISMPTALIEEADITLGTSGIRVRSMDPSHVAMVNLELAKSMFEDYVCDKETKIRLCINSTGKYGNGSSLIGQFPNKTKVIMSMKLQDVPSAKLELQFYGKALKQARIPILEPGNEETPIPKFQFNAKVKLILADLLETFKDLSKHSDNFRLTATRDTFKIMALSELAEQEYIFEKGSDVMLELDVREPSKATFNLNYMLQILKQLKTTFELVTLEWSTNMPLKISGENVEGATVEYYLAPRISEDDPIKCVNLNETQEPKPESERTRDYTVISEDKITVSCVTTTD